MSVQFRSNFSKPDNRWKVRHTPDPDLPASELAPLYTRRNKLMLRLIKDASGTKIYTSHLATEKTFLYGRFEARMRFLSPRGAHSAFWLQDTTPNQLGGAEVDIVEHFGSNTALWHNVYWRTPETMWPKEPTRWRMSSHLVSPRQWHVYGLDWYPDRYEFTIDGHRVGTTRQGRSSMPKVMILSLLSSTWEHDRLDIDHLSDYRTLVDWVKVSDLP